MTDDNAYARFLADRRDRIMERVSAACARVGRDASEVDVFAVSKTVDVDAVVSAMEAGYTLFGENRPQELARKLAGLGELGVEAPRFDMIGNLQTNKVNAVIGRVGCIQSVGSLHLAQAVSKRAEAKGIMQDVLIEVNVSGEASKGGFSADGAAMAAEDLNALAGINIRGLMTMAPAGDPEAARTTFRAARELAASLEREHAMTMGVLSYGMSDDYEIAIEEGATAVRLGRIVFDSAYTLDSLR